MTDNATFCTITGTTTYNAIDRRQFRCPVHGITTKPAEGSFFMGNAIDRTPHILVSLYDKPRYHCLLCYAEWLEKTIPRVEEEELARSEDV